jgi:hypothetical protein
MHADLHLLIIVTEEKSGVKHIFERLAEKPCGYHRKQQQAASYRNIGRRVLKHAFIDRLNWQFQIELLKLDRLARGKAFLLPAH